jgi:hypothetical protein
MYGRMVAIDLLHRLAAKGYKVELSITIFQNSLADSCKMIIISLTGHGAYNPES